MAKGTGTEHPNAEPLSDAEIREAIEGAGYAVEIELLNEMKQAGFPGAIGIRYAVAPTKYQEIDLMGRLHAKARAADGAGPVFSVFTLLIQVKRPSGPAAFVGIRGNELPESDRLVPRLGLVGSVMAEDAETEGVADLIFGEGPTPTDGPSKGLACSMGPFGALPTCVHWAIARRKKSELGNWVPWAAGEKGFFDDFEGLVQVREMQKANARERRLRDRVYLPRVGQYVLCMVVDSPTLSLYDPVAGTLESVSELSISKGFDTVHGPVYPYIDVVARPAFRAYLERCKAAAALAHDVVKQRREEVIRITEALKQRDEVDYLNSLP